MTPTLRTIATATLRATALAFACTAAALAFPPPPASATLPLATSPGGALPVPALLGAALALPPPPTSATPLSAASPHAASPAGMPPRGVWPLNPRPEIVRGFEPPPKPWLPGHRGLDLAGSPGQPVLSATAGTITYAGPLAGRGIVVVTTGPFRTTYEPVIPSTHVGATVAAGQQLGTLSTAGTHCPPHTCLHWGLRQATTYLNPLSLLATRPVRLLPLTPPASLKPSTPETPGTNHPATGAQRTSPESPATGAERSTPTSPADPRSNAPAADGSDHASGARDPAGPTGVRSSLTGMSSRPTDVRNGPTEMRSNSTGAGSSAADRSTGPGPAIVVGISAALTIGGSLLIRRH